MRASLPRERSLSRDDIVKEIRYLLKNPKQLLDFAQTLGQGHSNEKLEDAANSAIERVSPLVQRVFGDGASLTLQGSRAKCTHLDDSDFDYHIEGLGRDITLDEMYELKDEIDYGLNDIVITHRDIKVALLVMSSQDTAPKFQIEIVPEQSDYMDDEARITIEKATPYFRDHPSARNVVRVMKYMFLRTKPKLKNFEMEVMVEKLHGSHLGNGLPKRDPDATYYLFRRALEHILDQAKNGVCSRICTMAALVSKLERRPSFASPERRTYRAHSPAALQERASVHNEMPDEEQILACLHAARQSGRSSLPVREVYLLSLGRDPAKEQMGTGVKKGMNHLLAALKSRGAITSDNGLWSIQSSGEHSLTEFAMPDEEQILECLRAASRSGRGSLPVRDIYLMSLGKDPNKEQMGSGVRAKMERILKDLQSRDVVSCVSGPKEWSRWSLQT